MEPEEDFLYHLVPGENQGGGLHPLHHHVLCGRIHQKGDGATEICLNILNVLVIFKTSPERHTGTFYKYLSIKLSHVCEYLPFVF